MKLLLDTHVFLWWLEDPTKLSEKARGAIEEGGNTVFVSAAVIWEIVIKKQLGKLSVPDDFIKHMEAQNFLPLVISHEHALAVASLPNIHSDPFDRIQIAQAIVEGLTLVTRDQYIVTYDHVKIIKA